VDRPRRTSAQVATAATVSVTAAIAAIFTQGSLKSSRRRGMKAGATRLRPSTYLRTAASAKSLARPGDMGLWMKR
jgi:hypothetical protein